MHHNRSIATLVSSISLVLIASAPALTPAIAEAAGTGGKLDPTFGQSGFSVVPQSVYAVNDVRVDPSGRIVTSVCFAGLGDAIGGFGIDRLLPNGAPDTGFGSGGIAVAQFANGINFAMSTATQTDGKVVAVGIAESLPSGMHAIAIARFGSNGVLDQGFGSGGRVMPAVAGATQTGAESVIVLADGKILVGGSALFATGSQGILIRLNADGSPDASFGSEGIVETGLSGAVNGLGLQADGKIVALAGTTAARFLPNGTRDTRQARGTLVAEMHIGTSELRSDERIVAVFAVHDNGSGSDIDTQAQRFFPNGTVDASFQSPLFDFVVSNPDIFANEAHALAIQTNGSIVAGGGGQPAVAVTEFGLARLLAGGRLDRTFGRGGIVASKLNGNCEVDALGLESNGDIVAAGQSFDSTGGLIVARYLP